MKDIYAQKAWISLTESAPATLTFTAFSQFVSNLGQPAQAMLIHRVQYFVNDSTLALIAAAADYVDLALTLSNSITLVESNAELICRARFSFNAAGAGGTNRPVPFEQDFTALPGKGIIVPIKKLYGAIVANSIASATNGTICFYFTVIDIKAEDYLELTQVYNVVT